MNSDLIIAEFGLRPFGQKGWLKGSLLCPECGRNEKFAVLFTDTGAVTHCFYCAKAVPLVKILKDLGRIDLIKGEREFKGTLELSELKESKVDEPLPTVLLPIGFRRINDDPYLAGRGFESWQYDQFGVGVAELDPRTEGKLVFQIHQYGQCVGWLARSRESKEWHKENLQKHKETGVSLVLRYRNSESDFAKILGGLDEITPYTKTLILVEGLMDKANIDRLLWLPTHDGIKCCFTFGDDLSVDQIKLIPPSIETVILMYDAETTQHMRVAGERLMSLFEVQIALIEQKDIDPGNITPSYLNDILNHRHDFFSFYRRIFT